MRKEQSCCAFLAFDLKENTAGVLLTITAPGSAADAADALFDHFAPELAAPKLMRWPSRHESDYALECLSP